MSNSEKSLEWWIQAYNELNQRYGVLEKELGPARPVLEAALRIVCDDLITWHGHGPDPDLYYCEDCHASAPDSKDIVHEQDCRLADLIQAVHDFVAARAAGEEGR